MDATQATAQQSAATFTAVIHVHGMGSQRRYEESSALVDALDLYAHVKNAEGDPIGKLARIQARSEPLRDEEDETIGYVRGFWTQRTAGGWSRYEQVRFYEVYWAPVMAGQQSPWRTVRWIFSQALRPWRTALTRWRERQRLRRAALAQLFPESGPLPQGAVPGDFPRLVALYDDFEGLAAQRSHKAGHYRQFEAFIRAQQRGRTNAERLIAVARQWRRHYVANELKAAGVLLTMALGLLLAGAAAAYIVLVALRALAGLDLPEGLVPNADLRIASGLAATFVFAVGIGKFLTDYIGDVEAWSTYHETDEKHQRRQKVLDEATGTIAHVLGDDRCKRVVVTAHSLGTAVAHDALLALARRNRATNAQDPIAAPVDLSKIEHFVTFGSPIDKLEYFFESYTSSSHRFKRVVEELRGDIGTEPFSRNKKPHINWINFWDEGDVISGPLQSPLNRRRVAHRVQNVHVRHFHFPAPAASHGGYLDNRTVVGALFEMIFLRKWSIQALPSIDGQGPDYALARLPPGEAAGDRAFFHWIALALPWLALIGAIVSIVNACCSLAGFAPAMVAAIILAIGYVFSRSRGHRNPIERDRPPDGGPDQ